jgi:alpha-glucosidase
MLNLTMQNNSMNKVLIWLAFTLSAGTCPGQKYEVSSPDGRVMVIIEVNRKILYQVQFDGKEIILPSKIDLQLLNTRLSLDASVKRTKRRQVSDQIIPVVQEKRKVVKDHYNELAIEFKKPFSVIFRAYDDGIAYRFLTHFRDTIIIEHELAEVKFPHNPQVYYSSVVPREGTDIFHTSFEEPYQLKTLDSISKNDLIFSPLLVMPANGPKILLTESDLEDYPGMFMTGNNNAGLYGKFAPFPLEERMTEGEFPQYIVTRRAGYIARTSGNRSYPWRVIAIAKKDTDLPSTDIVYRLASPSRLKNT